MSEGEWLARLGEELRAARVETDAADQVVAEARAHLRDAGGEPTAVFGTPAAYARAVAASLDVGPPEPAKERGAPASRPARSRPAGPVRLQARGVSKRFGRRAVLRDVDLTVRSGEVAAVVGANGSGKTTLLRICAGLLAPDHGEVLVDGVLGYCPQHGGLADFLRPDEHFVLFGAGRDLDRGRARRAGRELAAGLSWQPAGQTLVRDLSGGTRQKLSVVLSTLGDPDVLLLDEPYQGFDRGTYVDFWEIVWRWRDAGKAVVVVTHLLNELDRVDTVLELTPPTVGGRAC